MMLHPISDPTSGVRPAAAVVLEETGVLVLSNETLGTVESVTLSTAEGFYKVKFEIEEQPGRQRIAASNPILRDGLFGLIAPL